jgi:branched chain amino acid efflux pump
VDTLAVIVGMAIVTYATRAPAVFLLSRQLPASLERFLSHIPAAVFAALLAPPLLAPRGAFAPGMEAAAAIPAALVAWWTRRVPTTILAGMASYWLIRWLAG